MHKFTKNIIMAENIKVVRERRRLNTDMNVAPGDENLHVRKLRSRNVPYDVTQRQLKNQNNGGQNPICLPDKVVYKETMK